MQINQGRIFLKYKEYMDQAESWHLITDYYGSISNSYP